MGIAYNSSIVTSGLVLALDAANTKSILSAVEVLVVAGGGGGGGSTAGGGGGGGVLYSSAVSITPGSAITATVGDGGAGTVRSDQGAPTNTSGGNSVFGALTAIGGGRGYSGSNIYTPRTSAVGGSGGGGGYYSGGLDPKGSGTSSAGTAGQGFAGGDGAAIGEWGGGGGGGAGGAGGAQVSDSSLRVGGPGLGFNISGTLQYYAGGGGGGAYSGNFSLGGIGGGGNGGDGNSYIPTAGATNTGGGGGGGGFYQYGPGGGAGGSGIVIVRYPGAQRATGGTVTSVGGYTVHTFTTSGTFAPTWTDLSGNGNTGTLTNGPTYNSGNLGSLVFDGVDDAIVLPTITPTPTATFNAWIYMNGTHGKYGAIFSNWGSGGDAYFIGTPPNATSIDVYINGGLRYTISALSANTWNMLTISHTASTAVAYINGVQTNTASSTLTSATNVSSIGYDTSRNNYPFKGNIAQVSIYNRALSAAEVSQNFNALRSRFSI